MCQNTPSFPRFDSICRKARMAFIRAQILVVLGDKLDESALRLHEEREVFDKVQQPSMLAQPPKHGFQRTRPLLLFGADPFPFGEVFPTGGDPAESTLGTVGEDNQRIVPEQLGNGVFVIAEIVGVGGGKRVRQSV